MKKIILALLTIPLVIFLWFLTYLLTSIFYHGLGWGDFGIIVTHVIYWAYSFGLMLYVFYLFSTEQIDKKLLISKAVRKKNILWIIGTEMFLFMVVLLIYGINNITATLPIPISNPIPLYLAYVAITSTILLAALINSIIRHCSKN